MTKDVEVRNIKHATTEDLEVGSSGPLLFQIKQIVPTGDHIHHVLVNAAEAKTLRDLLTEWLDDAPEPEPVKLTAREQFAALEPLAKFRFDGMFTDDDSHYQKLNDEWVQFVSDDGFRYDPETFDSAHRDRDLEEIQ